MEMNWEEFGEICEAVIRVGGAWAVIGTVAVFAIKYLRQIYTFISDMLLAPVRVKKMMEELKNNGGSSIKDQIQRIEARQISNELKLIHVVDSVENSGSFETDKEGKCTKVSLGYCHIMGGTEEEFTGTGWVNYLHPEDKDSVWESWNESIKNQRHFVSTYKIVRNDVSFKIFCRAYPIVNGSNMIGWFGIIKRMENN